MFPPGNKLLLRKDREGEGTKEIKLIVLKTIKQNYPQNFHKTQIPGPCPEGVCRWIWRYVEVPLG